MNPRSVSRFPIASARLRGADGGSVSLYCATAPHSGDPAAAAQAGDRGLQVVAADVVEVDVDPLGRRRLEADPHRTGLVVDGPVEARVVEQPAHLLRPAGAPDHERRALEPGQLPDEGPHRPGRRRHEHPVALAELADPQQARVCGEPRHTQDPQVGLGGGRLGVDDTDRPAGQQRVGAPPGVVQDGVAAPHHPPGAVGHVTAHRLDDADRAADHRRAEGERRHVGGRVVHPAAHVGVHRQEGVAHQQLAVVQRRQRHLDQLDVLGRRLPDRPSDQPPLGGHAVSAHVAYQPVVPGPPLNGPTIREVIQPP